PQLDHAGADAHRLAQHFPRHRARGHPHGRLAGRAATAAARVADAVLGLVGEVGVAGAEGAGDVAIVLRAGVLVLDQDRDRRTRGHRPGAVVVRARQDARRVALPALGDEAAAAGPAAVQPRLDVGLGQRDAGRTAVDDAADRRPVALAPGGHAEEVAEGVVGHVSADRLWARPFR